MKHQRPVDPDAAVVGVFGLAALAGALAWLGLVIWRDAGEPDAASEFAWALDRPITTGLIVGVVAFVVLALAAIVRALHR